MSEALVNRQKSIGFAIETTKGSQVSATTLTAPMANTNVYDPRMSPDDVFSDGGRRPALGSSGLLPPVIGMRTGTLTFSIDLTDSDQFMTLAKCCGFSVTTANVATPTLNQATHETGTFVVWEGGRKKILRGAAGTFTLDSAGAGQRVKANFTFRGIFDSVSDQAMPSDSILLTKGWRSAGSTLTLAAASIPYVDGFSLDITADVQPRETIEDDADSVASGLQHFIVAGFTGPTLTLAPEAATVANHDAFGKFLGGTQEALSLQFTDGSNTFTIASGKAQRTTIGDEERTGKLVDPITLGLYNSTGDDWLTLTQA